MVVSSAAKRVSIRHPTLVLRHSEGLRFDKVLYAELTFNCIYPLQPAQPRLQYLRRRFNALLPKQPIPAHQEVLYEPTLCRIRGRDIDRSDSDTSYGRMLDLIPYRCTKMLIRKEAVYAD